MSIVLTTILLEQAMHSLLNESTILIIIKILHLHPYRIHTLAKTTSYKIPI